MHFVYLCFHPRDTFCLLEASEKHSHKQASVWILSLLVGEDGQRGNISWSAPQGLYYAAG